MADEAIQSWEHVDFSLDCFVASLLTMTGVAILR